MREHRSPQEHVDDHSERDVARVQRPDDTLQLASQMGNVAFTAYARSVARQPAGEVIEMPEETIIGSVGPGESDEVIEMPEETIIGSVGGGESDEVIEMPEETITGRRPGEWDEFIEFPPD